MRKVIWLINSTDKMHCGWCCCDVVIDFPSPQSSTRMRCPMSGFIEQSPFLFVAMTTRQTGISLLRILQSRSPQEWSCLSREHFTKR